MLLVNDIYPTIQGEGVNTGIPMVLVRFQGCSAGCSWCDTKGAQAKDGGTLMAPDEIVDAVLNVAAGHEWVLLTGGEPYEQPEVDLDYTIHLLQRAGFMVAAETNGSQGVGGVYEPDWLTVSPKPQLKLHPTAKTKANEFKFVVGGPDDLPNMRTIPATAIICLQPLSQDKEATELCVSMVQDRGWRLSLQTHKYLNLK